MVCSHLSTHKKAKGNTKGKEKPTEFNIQSKMNENPFIVNVVLWKRALLSNLGDFLFGGEEFGEMF